ncbi:unnamed protein product [Nezara viridula]|uniref:H15 domain-containing protein n=1 Tax=Nezara viridula TaxID=85310 RepID=A0A9P0E8K8_NEZVI|nr:unnamed protein product [Nezara viridula]
MTETTTEAAAPTTPATPKAKKGKGAASTGAKKPKTAPSHPPVSQMVTAAIKSLKERGGSSTQAIKKYISSTYKIDAEKKSHFIKKYLVSAVASGSLVQTKGKGASGSFKLAGAGGEGKKVATTKKAPAKPSVASKSKSPKAKPATTKKAAAASKAKKTKKPPTAAKTPKPKVAKAKPATTPKAKKAPAKKAPAKKPAAKKASPKKK